MTKVLAINGSPRANGNTSIMLNIVLDELREEGIETELVQIGGQKIQGCRACEKCFERQDRKCAFDNDIFNDVVAKMFEADGILLGSPTYFSDITAEMKALIDRSGLVALANGRLFKRKVGAAVSAVRRAGSQHALNSMQHLFTISEMIIPASCYWNLCIGFQEGDVRNDEEGMNTMKVLGENMAWVLKKIGSSD